MGTIPIQKLGRNLFSKTTWRDYSGMPPHTSHKLQPLDISFMKFFKAYYSTEIETWLAAHPFRSVTVFQVGALIGKAFIRAATMEVSLNGFRKCGISPSNSQIFEPHDFIVEAQDESHCQSITSCTEICEQPETSEAQEQFLTNFGKTVQHAETSGERPNRLSIPFSN